MPAEGQARLEREVSFGAILKIALPMMLAYLSTALVGAVATAAIGRLADAVLAAGVAIAAIFFDVLLVSLSFLRSTTLGLTAIALGQGREAEAHAVCQRALVLGFGLGLVILALRGPEARFGLPLLGAHGPILRVARDYVLIRCLSAPMALANYAILGAFLGRSRAATGLVLQLVLNGTNILLSIWTVLGLHWGVQGVAWAAVAGETAACLLGLVLLSRAGGGRAWQGCAPALRDGAGWRHMGVLNRDTLIRTLSLLFSFAFFTRQGASLGAVVVAANAVHMQFFALSANCLDGFAAAAEQFAGRMIGAGSRPGFLRAVRLTLLASLVCGGGITLLYRILGPDFIALMTEAPAVRAAAQASLAAAALVPLVAAAAFTLDGIFIGATWSRDMRDMMLVSVLLFLAAWAVLMPRFGNAGLWAAFLFFMAVRGATLGMRLHRRLGRGTRLAAFGG
ncbi:MATE family efflux transporter [Acidisoma sp. C75]